MKLVLVIYSGSSPKLVPALLDQHHVAGYTEIDNAKGAGTTGRHEGTRAWPGDAVLYFSAVPAEQAQALTQGLKQAAAALPPGERLHVAVMPVEQFI